MPQNIRPNFLERKDVVWSKSRVSQTEGLWKVVYVRVKGYYGGVAKSWIMHVIFIHAA